MRRVQRAWSAAEEVLAENNISRAPVKVKDLAAKFARVIERDLDPEISGALMPPGSNGEWVIVVNKTHGPTRKRFTIAHELGHLLLHAFKTPHADRRYRFRDARSSEGSAFEEIQANQFAAELLMPRRMLMREVQNVDIDPAEEAHQERFEALVKELAERYEVSRQAMSIRLASLLT